MEFKNLPMEMSHEEDAHQDPNSGMKVKLLDELVEKIMCMGGDEEKSESPEEEASETPALEIKEQVIGKHDPLDLGDLALKDKLAKSRGL